MRMILTSVICISCVLANIMTKSSKPQDSGDGRMQVEKGLFLTCLKMVLWSFWNDQQNPKNTINVVKMVRVQEPADLMGCKEESSIANNDGFSKTSTGPSHRVAAGRNTYLYYHAIIMSPCFLRTLDHKDELIISLCWLYGSVVLSSWKPARVIGQIVTNLFFPMHSRCRGHHKSMDMSMRHVNVLWRTKFQKQRMEFCATWKTSW